MSSPPTEVRGPSLVALVALLAACSRPAAPPPPRSESVHALRCAELNEILLGAEREDACRVVEDCDPVRARPTGPDTVACHAAALRVRAEAEEWNRDCVTHQGDGKIQWTSRPACDDGHCRVEQSRYHPHP